MTLSKILQQISQSGNTVIFWVEFLFLGSFRIRNVHRFVENIKPLINLFIWYHMHWSFKNKYSKPIHSWLPKKALLVNWKFG